MKKKAIALSEDSMKKEAIALATQPAAQCDDPSEEGCPLPPIGSTRWGWTRKSGCCAFTSNFCRYVVFHDGDTRAYAEVWRADGGPVIKRIKDVATAMRTAELLARRDWHQENRSKK